MSSQAGLHELPSAGPFILDNDKDAGLVVSLNILSQLWVVPRAYAGRHMHRLGPELVDDWCGQIVEALQFLALAVLRCLPRDGL
jgi:hypothetical protein